MAKIITKVLDDYPGSNSTTEQAWDFIQRNVSVRRPDPGFFSVAPPICCHCEPKQTSDKFKLTIICYSEFLENPLD